MRVWLLLLFLLYLNFPSSGEEPLDRFRPGATMKAVQVPLVKGRPDWRRVGALTYLGGVRLTGSQSAFGGFSSMTLVGERFTLLSDGGHLVSFDMGADWVPRNVTFGGLPDGPQSGWLKADRDSESMTRDPATGRYWVGFEQYSAIWRYGPDGRAEAHVRPEAMKRWHDNGGPESMVRLRSGAFLVISETTPGPGKKGRDALRFDRDPTDPKAQVMRFAYQPPEEYDPTDMTELPDGRLLILNRRVSLTQLFTAKLVIVDPREIRAGAVVRGGEIASFVAPLIRDNFEALAVTREGGATIIWIASDDNRMWFEQSLLLKFRLDG
ncbi:esterase-like activity of phytase family protein [Sphingomonas sp. AOB5]|uniref:esterase-like activity of phytase family protein n=1 Tax=Sphingomonas sp. AOB5 TaxID=3034017 RepID=UPI0023F7CDFE|nr:esterase-like activity of phytase family protein [Sphingomonas sp. AOB5]MDF7776584.1 esterase-like activity of phytase family protein [Sphingomonas sp. AOB5]